VVKIDFNPKDYQIGICCIKQKEQSTASTLAAVLEIGENSINYAESQLI
jgi:hypothetical protein